MANKLGLKFQVCSASSSLPRAPQAPGLIGSLPWRQGWKYVWPLNKAAVSGACPLCSGRSMYNWQLPLLSAVPPFYVFSIFAIPNPRIQPTADRVLWYLLLKKKNTYKWTDAAQTRIVQGSTVGRGKLRGVCGGNTNLKGRLPALSHPFPPTSHHPRLAGEMPGWALALQNIYKSKAALRTKSSTFLEFPENAHPADQKIALLYIHGWDVCFAAFQRNFRESEAAFPVLSMQLWLLQISWSKVLI